MAKTNLVIVESPAKAKTIGKYLGPDYKVLASVVCTSRRCRLRDCDGVKASVREKIEGR